MTELATLEGYEEKFEKLLQGKRRLLENTTSEAEILAAEKELALQKEQCALLAEAGKQGEQILEYVGAIRDNLSVVAIERIRTAKGSLMLLREQV